MALIEGEDVARVISIREHYDRGVGEADAEGTIPLDHSASRVNILVRQRGELVDAFRQLLEKEKFALDAGKLLNEIVHLRQDQRRDDARRVGLGQHARAFRMLWLIGR